MTGWTAIPNARVRRDIPARALTSGVQAGSIQTLQDKEGAWPHIRTSGIPTGTRARVDDVRMGRVYITFDPPLRGLRLAINERIYDEYFE